MGRVFPLPRGVLFLTVLCGGGGNRLPEIHLQKLVVHIFSEALDIDMRSAGRSKKSMSSAFQNKILALMPSACTYGRRVKK